MTPAEISVIIPSLNEASLIERTIDSAAQSGARQIIVCDGGSDDGTTRVAERAGAQVFVSEPGRGRQLRYGAEQATCEYLLFLHADNTLGPSCLEQVCRAIESNRSPHSPWGGFRQQIANPQRIYRWLEHGNASRILYRGMPFGDQAMFVSQRTYWEVGGFEAVPLMEDVKLSRALRQRSWPLLLEGPVRVEPRRWEESGVVRQTARNWMIQIAHRLGVGECRLARWYHGAAKKPRSNDRGF